MRGGGNRQTQTDRLRRGRQIKADRQRGRMGWGGGGSQLTYSTYTVYTGMKNCLQLIFYLSLFFTYPKHLFGIKCLLRLHLKMQKKKKQPHEH